MKIENANGVIREIQFHAGLNLIVDETPSDENSSTGNNVGKTTVLKLIDLCLGGDPKRIFTDPEDKKSEYVEVKKFLIDTKVLVTLILCTSLEGVTQGDIRIERNFLSRNKIIRRINGVNYTEEEFETYMRSTLFPEYKSKKPTFRQIISHNIRYKEPGLSNTLRTLDEYTRPEEYEALYLFLLGCDFDQGDAKQVLLTQLRTESSFKKRLEARQTKSAYQISLSFLLDEIKELQRVRASYKEVSELDSKIARLGEVKYQRSVVAGDLAKVKLRHQLVQEAVHQVRSQKSHVDTKELWSLYSQVAANVTKLTKSFEDLVAFHNRMVEEKVRYIAKDLPQLEIEIERKEFELAALARQEGSLVDEVSKDAAYNDMESIIADLNEKHGRRGEYETIIGQITAVDESIGEIKKGLAELDRSLFSDEAKVVIDSQLIKLNRHFTAVSEELYGEKYALKCERIISKKTDQQVYEFSCFATNFSTGKKQGEIACFDIAYTLFADEQEIPCYHFLLNDKKELVHHNQLERIGQLVNRKGDQLQFVASILRDKLPLSLNKESYIVVKLSQVDKLFRIESAGRAPVENEGYGIF
ncbi:MAG: DUF2326 domain-containing protein [Stenotrophomonas sp.]|uniref:DUF2326 domain-containing protein n=1 Tax=Stenotrophomonas sp. TaxID=69392 RepID=UPI003D6CD380